jgi:hypothetical protein
MREAIARMQISTAARAKSRKKMKRKDGVGTSAERRRW